MSAGLDQTRMRAIEEAMFRCRPSLETVLDGDWVWRYAKGYTGRANSLQSLNAEDVNNAEKRLAVHVQRSRDYGIVPKFRVTPLGGQKIVDLLDVQGWSTQGHTLVLRHVCSGGGGTGAKANNISVVAPLSTRWQQAMAGLLGLEAPVFEIYREMLAMLPVPARGFLMYSRDSVLVSVALGVVADGMGAVFSLTSVPHFRRQGFGRGLMGFIHGYLRNEGAKQVVLQVEAHNKPAIGLYRSLGYEEAYSYTYRTLEAAE